jgi:hypothetical protein
MGDIFWDTCEKNKRAETRLVGIGKTIFGNNKSCRVSNVF